MKTEMQIIADYTGLPINKINPDSKFTIADCLNMLTVQANAYKVEIAKKDQEIERLNSFGWDE